MEEQKQTLYDRIGGEIAVMQLVNTFYNRVFDDERLTHFFDYRRVDQLKSMQKEFFTIALGGPGDYSDINLAHAHQGRNIEIEHFKAFVQHLFDTLEEFDFSEEERLQIISEVNTYVGDIIDADEVSID